MELHRTYDAEVVALKEKPQKRVERAGGLHAWANLQSSSGRKKIEASEKSNAVLCASITYLTAKPCSECLKLQQKLQREKGNTALQAKGAA